MNPDQRRAAILRFLYGPKGPGVATRLEGILDAHRSHRTANPFWDETDAWLITYPDQFQRRDEPPLRTLLRFFEANLSPGLDGMHILPFYPWSSDDGFAVIDPTTVDSRYGSWHDVETIAARHRLAIDAVINHLSAESTWFRRFLAGDPAFEEFFITADPQSDLTSVVRPRTTPLLTRFSSVTGDRWVWTTFSADQVDLNYHNPEVLLRVVDLLLGYAAHGARVIRLDAIAFIWKEPETSCMSLPQTHQIVELIRSCLDATYPGTLILTETNVPHTENVSYFGSPERPEAHIVYQFPLAPLVLHTLRTGDTTALSSWAAALDTMPGTTFLNFLASHDGVGVRPAEGLLSGAEIGVLCDLAIAAGGSIGTRSRPDGSTAPYELDATWFDLLRVGYGEDDAIARHLAGHAIMLALRGIPAIYVHSLFGTSSDLEAYQRTRLPRSLNRHRFEDLNRLEQNLRDPSARAHRIMLGLRAMLDQRRKRPAFHPEADQRILDAPQGVVAIERGIGREAARVIVNVTPEPIGVGPLTHAWRTLAQEDAPSDLDGWQTLWLHPK